MLVEEILRTDWQQDFYISLKSKNKEAKFKSDAEKVLIKQLRYNSKLWTSAHAKALNTEVQPLQWSKLWHRQFKSFWPVRYVDGKELNLRRNRKITEIYSSNGNRINHATESVCPLTPDILDYILHLFRLVQIQGMNILVQTNQYEITRPIVYKDKHSQDFALWNQELKRALIVDTTLPFKNPFLSGLGIVTGKLLVE